MNYVMQHSAMKPSSDTFILHSHDNYEILYFLNGDADYIVEGSVYPLKPNDIVLIRPHEMHRIMHKSNILYERVIININSSFFSEMNCNDYTEIFTNRESGTKNKIDAEIVEKSGISDCYERLKKYTSDFANCNIPVASAIITEILHILNHIDINDAPAANGIRKIISYINNNFDKESITLSEISDMFFISKSHLAREFKRMTGYTVSGYINKKRINSVIVSVKKGASLGEASTNAGFKDYTSFYRAFFKEFGCGPKKYINSLERDSYILQ